MKNIGFAILAVCLGMIGSIAAQAQFGSVNIGNGALASNSTGDFNAALGYNSLNSNISGWDNTAAGAWTLYSNISGGYNTAVGASALYSNTTGWDNIANGAWTLYSNINGYGNIAIGESSLYSNTGDENMGVGNYSLYSNTSGGYNIGIGYAAGYLNPAGASNNIDIGNWGSANDNNPTIRIGTPGTQAAFFAAGIRGVLTGSSNAVEVMIDSNGQMGTINSSIRFKEDVHDMAAASDGLMRLRPVTYRYKQPYANGSKPVDYGLIAEEVAEVYPDLVARDADGQIQTVQYQKLTPMLLNELQKEHRQLEEQQKIIEQQAKSAAEQTEINQRLEKRLAALETALPSVSSEIQLVTK